MREKGNQPYFKSRHLLIETWKGMRNKMTESLK